MWAKNSPDRELEVGVLASLWGTGAGWTWNCVCAAQMLSAQALRFKKGMDEGKSW